jgi:hypothetical protein
MGFEAFIQSIAQKGSDDINCGGEESHLGAPSPFRTADIGVSRIPILMVP